MGMMIPMSPIPRPDGMFTLGQVAGSLGRALHDIQGERILIDRNARPNSSGHADQLMLCDELIGMAPQICPLLAISRRSS